MLADKTSLPAGSIGALPDTRRAILHLLKQNGALTAGEVAKRLDGTREAARQQLQLLEEEGWVARASRTGIPRTGRPAVAFSLTPAADHLFPKHYDTLSLILVDTVAEQFGEEALVKLLTALTDQQVARWEPKLAGKPLAERIRLLKGIYFDGDPFTSVKRDRCGYMLVERNCPYLSLAMRRPRLCSVTVSTLIRLLGVRVVREKRFQDGAGRCVFRVLADQPVDPGSFRFALEETREQRPVAATIR